MHNTWFLLSCCLHSLFRSFHHSICWCFLLKRFHEYTPQKKGQKPSTILHGGDEYLGRNRRRIGDRSNLCSSHSLKLSNHLINVNELLLKKRDQQTFNENSKVDSPCPQLKQLVHHWSFPQQPLQEHQLQCWQLLSPVLLSITSHSQPFSYFMCMHFSSRYHSSSGFNKLCHLSVLCSLTS